MAFDAAFALAKISPSTFQLIDQSTGADATILYRQIFLYKYNSTTIVPSGNPSGQIWIEWPIADTEITLTDILDTDVALNVYVVWYTPTPTGGDTYTVNQAHYFTDYNEEFNEAIWAEKAVAQPNIVNSTNFMYYVAALRLNIDGAAQIVTNASDVTKAQQLINAANQIRDNQSFYF